MPSLSARHLGLAAIALAACASAFSSATPRVDPEVTRGLLTRLDEADEALHSGRVDEADALYRDSLPVARTLGEVNIFVARALDGLAEVHRHGGRHAEAKRLHARALTMWETLLGPRQPRVATTLHNLALACAAEGRPDEAEVHLLRALEIWSATLGEDSPEAGQTRKALDNLERARVGEERGR